MTFSRLIQTTIYREQEKSLSMHNRESTARKKHIEATVKLLRFAPHETCLHMHRNFFSIHAVIEMVFELFSSNIIITLDYRTALRVSIQQVLQRCTVTPPKFGSFTRFPLIFSNIFPCNYIQLTRVFHCGIALFRQQFANL
jgi:hypothetical protein